MLYSDKDRINFFVTAAKDACTKEEWVVAAMAIEQLTQLRGSASDWAWLGQARARSGATVAAWDAFTKALRRDSGNQIAIEGLRLLRDSPSEDFFKCRFCPGVDDSAKAPRCQTCGWPKCECWACYCEMPDDVRAKLKPLADG